jgi:hypothetical protein
MFDRVLNEPVLISTAVIAVGNALGHDLSSFETVIQTVAVFVVGLILRYFVSPTRSL